MDEKIAIPLYAEHLHLLLTQNVVGATQKLERITHLSSVNLRKILL